MRQKDADVDLQSFNQWLTSRKLNKKETGGGGGDLLFLQRIKTLQQGYTIIIAISSKVSSSMSRMCAKLSESVNNITCFCPEQAKTQ